MEYLVCYALILAWAFGAWAIAIVAAKGEDRYHFDLFDTMGVLFWPITIVLVVFVFAVDHVEYKHNL